MVVLLAKDASAQLQRLRSSFSPVDNRLADDAASRRVRVRVGIGVIGRLVDLLRCV